MVASQFRLARQDALIHLAILGLITGFLAGGVIVLFRLSVEKTQDYLLPGKGPENYEALPTMMQFLFPFVASVVLAYIFYKWSKGIRVLGVARVMERVAYHQGQLTWRGFFMQFVGAAVAIIGGHSVGREGPHAYLGAGAASLFGQLFKLPNNSIRTLVASGAAAGIAASFNTPLAGVVFALEVIMMEYALNSFIPVMLAAVVATALSNAVLGGDPAFSVPVLHATPLTELPLVLVLGFTIGAFAALFNHVLTVISTRTQPIAIWWRLLASGVLLGLIGIMSPEILGIGYDTVNATLLGEFALSSLLILTFAKLFATSISVGLGVPGGMIGPAFFIGATLGGAIGMLASWVYDGNTMHIGFYALLGMGAMMGASLQAPLAALTAIMELTYNPGIIMPGMLAIVVAQLTASELFKKESLFITLLRSNGLHYSVEPVMQVLRSVGVASMLNSHFVRHSHLITREEAETILKKELEWIIIDDKKGNVDSLMPVTELAKYLIREESDESAEEENQSSVFVKNPDESDHALVADVSDVVDAQDSRQQQTPDSDDSEQAAQQEQEAQQEMIDLLEIPAKRLHLTPISLRANLMRAHELFEQGAEALYVVFQEDQVSSRSYIYGVLTKADVEAAYVPKSVS